MPTVRTGESTCIGHPDKLCDLIADTILDDLLVTDPAARCAVEVMATKGRIIAAGVSTSLEARDGNESAFVLTGAGDQDTVYGYATAETRERLPLLLVIAHDICSAWIPHGRMG